MANGSIRFSRHQSGRPRVDYTFAALSNLGSFCQNKLEELVEIIVNTTYKGKNDSRAFGSNLGNRG
jgi:hypothetical protein